jgi:hypothetical protein
VEIAGLLISVKTPGHKPSIGSMESRENRKGELIPRVELPHPLANNARRVGHQNFIVPHELKR